MKHRMNERAMVAGATQAPANDANDAGPENTRMNPKKHDTHDARGVVGVVPCKKAAGITAMSPE
jgi:hypothetical protein